MTSAATTSRSPTRRLHRSTTRSGLSKSGNPSRNIRCGSSRTVPRLAPMCSRTSLMYLVLRICVALLIQRGNSCGSQCQLRSRRFVLGHGQYRCLHSGKYLRTVSIIRQHSNERCHFRSPSRTSGSSSLRTLPRRLSSFSPASTKRRARHTIHELCREVIAG